MLIKRIAASGDEDRDGGGGGGGRGSVIVIVALVVDVEVSKSPQKRISQVLPEPYARGSYGQLFVLVRT